MALHLTVLPVVACTVLTLMTAAGTSLAGAPRLEMHCELTADDKAANAQLTFDAFDQRGTTATTWRQLNDRGCNDAALESAEDYLAHAHFEKLSEQRDIIFHIAQTLGMLGRYDEAALMVASAKNPTQGANSDLDWNTYLEGTWSFFKRNLRGVQRAQTQLNNEPGSGNNLNSLVLHGLISCFDKPYSIAYGRTCRTGR